MSRIKLVEIGKADIAVIESYKSLEQSRGNVPNLFKALGYSAAMLGPALQMADFTSAPSKVSVKEKQLAYLVASRLNNCEYCLERHSRAGLKAGMSQAQVAALHQEGDLTENLAFNQRERLIIHFAQELTATASLTDKSFASMQPIFSDEELAELALVVASANMFNRLVSGLGIELEPEFHQ